uniref:NADH-ubiquinone oxidoreductase chain 2 n=1 Tax=Apochrysa matsumurae TaxID=417555 RepID=E6N2M5_APOMA|nr:NADH dehydrogenase subunit 2 [Apochrysa matsumurae]BAJ61134.1 NADH dehydrogenase subunit 2 [Apochrysa matsumurae]
MKKSVSNFVFLTTLILGSLISISSNNWMGAWMGLEINLLSFIPLMNNLKNSMSTEASLKYFLVQALASAILLFSVVIMSLFNNIFMNLLNNIDLFNFLMNSSLFMKMGVAPFHFWFPEVIEGMNWMISIILMTWQKLAPMILLSYCISFFYLNFIILFSIFIGSMGGLNQISLRKIMAYSSINHMGWMLSSFLISNYYWLIYFLIYCFLSISVIFNFMKYNIHYLSQTFNLMKFSPILKFIIFCNFLSLGGLPPFSGFFPKWIIIQNLNNYFLITMMVCLTLITLFYYLRVTYSAFMINYSISKWSITISDSKNSLIFNFFSLFGLFFCMIFYTIF